MSGKVHIKGNMTNIPKEWDSLPDYEKGTVADIPDNEFRRLYGKELPERLWDKNRELDINDTFSQMYYARSWMARLIFAIMNFMKKRSEKRGVPSLNVLFIYNMPFRGISKMTGGAVSMEMVDGIVELINGHFFRGIGKLIGGFFKNRG